MAEQVLAAGVGTLPLATRPDDRPVRCLGRACDQGALTGRRNQLQRAPNQIQATCHWIRGHVPW